MTDATSSYQGGTATASLVLIEWIEKGEKQVAEGKGLGVVVRTVGILLIELFLGHDGRTLCFLIDNGIIIVVVKVNDLAHVDV